MSVAKIQFHLDNICRYLTAYTDLSLCHMVNYLQDEHWKNLIPQSIKNEIKNVSDVENAIEVFLSPSATNQIAFPNLSLFLSETRKHYLENLEGVALTLQNIRTLLRIECPSKDSVSVKDFMNEKKNHEVEITSQLIADIVRNNPKNTIVVDAGDGKGYLSSRLALAHNLNILGIDANEGNTKNAQERNVKLKKAWNGLTKRAELIKEGIKPPKRGKSRTLTENIVTSSGSYKTLNQFITEETNFLDLVRQNFNFECDDISLCLTGLHTCGNLAPTCLKIFSAREELNVLCNIGCCYHLITEEFGPKDLFANAEITNKHNTPCFPLSKYLKEKQVQLGRNARMIASQSVHRTNAKQELPNQSLYFRALLEVLIREKYPQLDKSVQVGKIKNYTSFAEYVCRCEEKLKLNLDKIELGYIKNLIERYESESSRINLFYFIRMSLAPVVEAIILLDRLLFLKEKGIEKSYLVQLFDPVISPRCYGIIAVK